MEHLRGVATDIPAEMIVGPSREASAGFCTAHPAGTPVGTFTGSATGNTAGGITGVRVGKSK